MLTGAMFLALSAVWASAVAYTVSFGIGVAFALVVTPRFVFRARVSNARRIRYVGWYLTVYVFGLGVVYFLHDKVMLGNTMVAIVTFVATAGLSFLGARFLFDQRSERAGEPMDSRTTL